MSKKRPEYSKRIKQRIVKKIEETGTFKSVWEGGIVSRKVFRDWRDRYEDFEQAVQLAKNPKKYSEANPLTPDSAEVKYSPSILKIVLEAIAQHGSLKAGWEAARIDKEQFVKWYRSIVEFGDAILEVKSLPRSEFPPPTQMGRRSVYTRDRTAKALVAIELFGSDRAGWEAAGIAETTFYKWSSEHDLFADRLTQARVYYKENPRIKLTLNELQDDAMFQLAKWIRGEQTVTSYTCKIISESKNGEEQIVSKETITKTENKPPPLAAIKMVLPDGFDVLNAIFVLASNKCVPQEGVGIVAQHLDGMRKELGDLLSKKGD